MTNRFARQLTPLFLLLAVASCGGGDAGTGHLETAQELSVRTGNPALVGDFEISNLAVDPTPIGFDGLMRITFDAKFVGQSYPNTNGFVTGFIRILDGYASFTVFSVYFYSESGTFNNGLYFANVDMLVPKGSIVGVHSVGTRIDPVANGYAFVGTDATALIDVTFDASQRAANATAASPNPLQGLPK